MPKDGQNDNQALAGAIATVERERDGVILFQVLGKTIPQYQTDSSFDKVKIFQNEDNILLVLYK